MTEYLVLQDYKPGIYSGQIRILKGWKVRQLVDGDPVWDVVDAYGRKMGTTTATVVGNLNKTPVIGATGRTILQEVGAEIKRARELKEWTAEMLAAKIGASRQYISNVERGSGSCSLLQLSKICDILNFELRIKVVRKYGNVENQCLNTNKKEAHDQTT